MSNSLKIIARVRELVKNGTDYAVAKALGMNQSNLTRILHGKGHLGDKAQRKAAELLGLPFADINALVNEDKAQTEAERSYWRSLCAERIRAAIDAAGKIAAAVIIAAALTFRSGDALAHLSYDCNKNIHYAQYRRRLWQRLRDKARAVICRLHGCRAGLRMPSVA